MPTKIIVKDVLRIIGPDRKTVEQLYETLRGDGSFRLETERFELIVDPGAKSGRVVRRRSARKP